MQLEFAQTSQPHGTQTGIMAGGEEGDIISNIYEHIMFYCDNLYLYFYFIYKRTLYDCKTVFYNRKGCENRTARTVVAMYGTVHSLLARSDSGQIVYRQESRRFNVSDLGSNGTAAAASLSRATVLLYARVSAKRQGTEIHSIFIWYIESMK